MAATPYSPVQWSKGPIKLEQLQQLSQNDQWLFENSPRMLYSSAGLKKAEGLKIAAGKSLYPTTDYSHVQIAVYFNNFFAQGCIPVVTATVNVLGYGRRYVSITGLDVGSEVDHRGFNAYVSANEFAVPNVIEKQGYVSWIAIGY